MFCARCGKEVPEGHRFCTKCGATVTQETPVTEAVPGTEDLPAVVEAPEEKAAPALETAPVEEVPAPETIPVAEEAPVAVAVAEPDAPWADQEPAPAPKKKGVGKKIAIGVLCVALVGAVATAGVFAARKLLGGGKVGGGRTPVYAYLTESDKLMYLPDLKEKTQALEVDDRELAEYSVVQFSRDGKSLYYLTSEANGGRNDLYRATLDQIKKGMGGERIVRDVDSFWVLDDKNVAFWKDDYTALGIYNGADDDILAKNCGYNTLLSDDEKSFYYVDRDGGAIYRYDLASGEKEKLAETKGMDTVWTDLDAEVLVYTVIDGDGDNNITVYTCAPGQEPKKVATGVYAVNSVTVKDGKVRMDYTTQQTREATLYDFVNDPGDAGAADLTEPDYDEYRIWDVFYDYDANRWSYEDYATTIRHPVNVSSLLTGGQTAMDLEWWDVRALVAEQLNEAYNARYEAWQNASRREELRRELQNEDYTVTSYDLYRYVDGATDLVAAGVTDIAGSDGVYFYHKAPGEEKVVDLDELDAYGWYDAVYDAIGSEQWYQNANGTEQAADLGGEVRDLYWLSETELVLKIDQRDGTCLQSYTVEADGLKLVDTLSKGAGYYSMVRMANAKGEPILYYVDDEQGTLARYWKGKGEELADGVRGAWISDDGETCYAVVTEDGGKTAQLVRVKDGKSTTVTDDLATDADYTFCGDMVLYIARDGYLYVWDGKDSRRLAKNVKSVWANSEEWYTWLYSGFYY